MADIRLPRMHAVYTATSDEDQKAAYDDWAPTYDADLLSWGFRLPAITAAAFARTVDIDAEPILDAGCGTGLQSDPLAAMGYGPIIGVDLSPGMLASAARKGIYAELRPMQLGKRLDFADDTFAATLAIGCITPGHAPPSAFAELIRVTRAGGHVVFSMRVDTGQDPAYLDAIESHTKTGHWRERWCTPRFHMLPEVEPELEHVVYVFDVCR